MRFSGRRLLHLDRLRVFMVLTFVAALGAACGSSPTTPGYQAPAQTAPSAVHPEHIYPAPAGLVGIGQPQSAGTIWMLAGNQKVKTLSLLNLERGVITSTVPVSANASSISEAPGGLLGIGLATPTGGALWIANPSTAAITSKVPVAGPVRQVAASATGNFYVLNGNPGGAANVAIIGGLQPAITAVVPVSSDAVWVIPSPDGSELFVLEPTGTVEIVSVATKAIVGHFPIGKIGVALAISNDGTTLFAMKKTPTGCNVGVVNVLSQQVTKVLPAPAQCVDLVTSADGNSLYDAVGSITLGNVQQMSLSS